MGYPRGSNPSDCVDLARVLRGRPRPNGGQGQHNTCYCGAGTPSPTMTDPRGGEGSSILPIGISTIGLA
jgi:hypothetical protein